MKRALLIYFLLLGAANLQAQFTDLPFRTVSHKDIEMKKYLPDSSANAVVLDERGQAFIDLEDGGDLMFEYYVKIKILNKNGLKHANFEIPLYKGEKYKENVEWVMASTYNYVGNNITETKMDFNKKFIENFENYDLQKLTLPNVKEGSVIEIKYKVRSPFIRTFQTWHFQSDIPKIRSEYTAKIPATYLYNIALRGFLKLSVNESKVEEDCYVGYTGGKANCSVFHFGMENVPAFKEEDYMTSSKNFLSAIYFELNTVSDFNGQITKYTEEWSDVDRKMINDENFGKQIKKASNVLADSVARVTNGLTDDLTKAKKIYQFMASYFNWDGEKWIYTKQGAKKAYETRKGNVADINLSLVGALQQAGLSAYPIILSTRDNGLAIELYPVITGFNYVVAAVDISGVRYLLDATSNLLPFGVLPVRCLNGKGRLISKESAFVDLKPTQKTKDVKTLELTMSEDGHVDGKMTISRQGYYAISQRSEIASAEPNEKYIAELQKGWSGIIISNYHCENVTVIDKPLIEKANLKIEDSDASNASTIFFNPFVIDRIGKNPFTSSERAYPVDYGAPVESTFILSLTFPASWMVEELPKSFALALPQGGGKYTFSASQAENKVSIISNQIMTKAIYDSNEYHYLKELYARIIQVQQSQIVFKKK